jgi:hypothetical protein
VSDYKANARDWIAWVLVTIVLRIVATRRYREILCDAAWHDLAAESARKDQP